VVEDSSEAYALGLWCADGYHRTSSFGLSNIDLRLIQRFAKYLLKNFAYERLRLRVYIPTAYIERLPSNLDKICSKISCLKVKKARHISYQIYVNSRPLLRRFKGFKARLELLANDEIIAYFAGRFDGDGSVASDFRRDLRIVYSNIEEANKDKQLLSKVRGYKTRIYRYNKANTYCLYVSRNDARNFLQDILPFSQKMRTLCPVETEGASPK